MNDLNAKKKEYIRTWIHAQQKVDMEFTVEANDDCFDPSNFDGCDIEYVDRIDRLTRYIDGTTEYVDTKDGRDEALKATGPKDVVAYVNALPEFSGAKAGSAKKRRY